MSFIKFINTTILVISIASTMSQVTYQSSDYAVLGDTFIVSNAGPSALPFDQGGFNVNWDFSSLVPIRQFTRRFIDPNDGGYKNTWCLINGLIFTCNSEFNDLTNLAEKGLDTVDLMSFTLTNVVNHYRTTSDALEYTMLGGTLNLGGFPVVAPFENQKPDTIFQFPLQYGNLDSSNGEMVLDLTPVGYSFKFDSKTKRVNSVDGWGTISTPYLTLDSVIKVTSLIYRDDTINYDTVEFGVKSTQIEYYWLHPNFKQPIVKASGVYQMGSPVITQVEFLDSLRCFPPMSFFVSDGFTDTLDASGNATINFTSVSFNADSYSWDFGDGATSTSPNPSHTYSDSGNYTVTLAACNSSCSPLECDTFSNDVTIIDTTAAPSSLLHAKQNFSFVAQNQMIKINAAKPLKVNIFNTSGALVEQSTFATNHNISTKQLPAGLYLVKMNYKDDHSKTTQITRKLVVR